MKELLLNVDSMGTVNPSGYAGFMGEHNAGRIVVRFTNGDIPVCDYFRMYFETGDGQKVYTGRLQPKDGNISYDLPFDVTSLSHTLYWQLCGYTMENDECTLIYKTEVAPISLGGSLATDGSLANNKFFSEVQTALDEIDEFTENFDIQIGDNIEIAPTESPFATINKEGDYKFAVNLHLPASVGKYHIEEIPDSITIPLNYDCTPTAEALSRRFAFKMFNGQTPVDVISFSVAKGGDYPWQVSVSDASNREITLSIPEGTVIPSALPADQYFILSATSGTVSLEKRIYINYARNAATPHIGDNGNWFVGEDDTGVGAGISGIKKANFTISPDIWDENLRTPNVPNASITTRSFIILKPRANSVEEFNNCNVSVYSQTNGYVSFSCTQLPQNRLTLDVLIVNL